MKRFLAAALVCVMVGGAAAAAQGRKYGVTATVEQNVDFASFKTYSWTSTRPSSDKTIDAQIVAAVDRELAGLGMRKVTASPDVFVTYSSLTRTDVDVNAKPDARGVSPQSEVGTLVVGLLDKTSRRPLLRLRADEPIDQVPNLEAVIGAVTKQMFEQYPTRQPARK